MVIGIAMTRMPEGRSDSSSASSSPRTSVVKCSRRRDTRSISRRGCVLGGLPLSATRARPVRRATTTARVDRERRSLNFFRYQGISRRQGCVGTSVRSTHAISSTTARCGLTGRPRTRPCTDKYAPRGAAYLGHCKPIANQRGETGRKGRSVRISPGEQPGKARPLLR
jgi:hypothetical protein